MGVSLLLPAASPHINSADMFPFESSNSSFSAWTGQFISQPPITIPNFWILKANKPCWTGHPGEPDVSRSSRHLRLEFGPRHGFFTLSLYWIILDKKRFHCPHFL